MTRRSARTAGFTFIEIVIVIVIMGALLTIVAPKLGRAARKGRLDSGARSLAATLRQARHAAILLGDGCEVRLDPAGGRYQIVPIRLDLEGQPIDGEEPPEREKTEFALSGEAVLVQTLPEGVAFSLIHSAAPLTADNDLPRVVFSPDGSATAARIGIQNEDLRAFNVEVYRTTGMVKVNPGRPVVPEGEQPIFYLPDAVDFNSMTGEGG